MSNLKEKFEKGTSKVVLYFLATIIITILAYNLSINAMRNGNQITKIFKSFKNQWEYKGELYSLPYKFSVKANEPLVLKNKIPENFKRDDAFCFQSFHQEVKVYHQNTLIYEYRKNETSKGVKAIPNKWHVVTLNNQKPGDEITFEFISPYEKYSGSIWFISYGNLREILKCLMRNIVFVFLLSLASIVAGTVILITKFLMSKNLNKSFVYLGLFFIIFGLWSSTNIKLLFNLEPNVFYKDLFEVGALLLIPIILLLFIRERVNLKENKSLNWIIKICFSYFLVCNFLQIFQIVDYVKLIPSYIWYICITSIYIISITHFKIYVVDRNNYIQRIGIFIFTGSIILDELMYINKELYFSGMYIRIGVICFLFSQLIVGFQEVNKKLKNKIIIKKQLEESRIKLMTRQMEPHFYSNALIAIQDLCYTDADKAADSIALFYSYLRANINYINEEGLISFQEEKNLIHMYIKIQQLCYGDEIEYIEDLKVEEFSIPPLTIQPFIENAVHHGVRKRRGVGTIKLSSYYQDDLILITIEDNGVGFQRGEEKDEDSTFSSTRNILYRIEKQCKGQVDFESVEGKGTTVTIKIPRSFIRGVM